MVYDYKDFMIRSLDCTQLCANPDRSVLNPGMIVYQDKLHFAYRTGCAWWRPTSIIVGELNPKTYLPDGEFKQLKFAINPNHYSLEDPRFFVHNNQLWIQISVIRHINHDITWGKIGIVNYNTQTLRILQVDGGNTPLEKNWVFFEYEDELYCTYALFNGQHAVYKVDERVIKSCYQTAFVNIYPTLSGTSNLVLKDGLLWGVGHTKTVKKQKLWIAEYSAIFYAINPGPPFQVVYLQKSPFISTNGEHRTFDGRTIGCIFPSGLIADGDDWIISAGINDLFISILRIPHAEVTKTLRGG